MYLFLGLSSWVRLHNYTEIGPSSLHNIPFHRGSIKLSKRFCVCQLTISTSPLIPRSSYVYRYYTCRYIDIYSGLCGSNIYSILDINLIPKQPMRSSMESSLLFSKRAGGLLFSFRTYRPSWCGKQSKTSCIRCMWFLGALSSLLFLFSAVRLSCAAEWPMTQLRQNMSMVRNPSLISGTTVGQ